MGWREKGAVNVRGTGMWEGVQHMADGVGNMGGKWGMWVDELLI